jgi:hypothetical protein
LTQMGVQGQNKNLKEIGYKNIEVAWSGAWQGPTMAIWEHGDEPSYSITRDILLTKHKLSA